jgi:hypothetical protein
MFEQLVLRACRFILYYSVFFCTIKSRPKLLLCWSKIQIRYICVTMIMTFSLVFLHYFSIFQFYFDSTARWPHELFFLVSNSGVSSQQLGISSSRRVSTSINGARLPNLVPFANLLTKAVLSALNRRSVFVLCPLVRVLQIKLYQNVA